VVDNFGLAYLFRALSLLLLEIPLL
jgi:hypothetical protein